MNKTLLVCCGTGCLANGALKVVEALKTELNIINDNSTEVKAHIKETGCNGFCENGPIVKVLPDDISYYKVKPTDAKDIIIETIVNNRPVDRLLYIGEDGKRVHSQHENPFYAKQHKIALRNIGEITPGDIDDYTSRGGFEALKKALTMLPEDIISEVELSGLRGRGGAGFPTGRKWRQCASFDNFPKYAVCNGDEGDPGAFMDRSMLEGDPHSIIEGLTICAIAIGATEGYFYIRDEYELALKNVEIALETARQNNYLGENILNSGKNFDIRVVRGGGAFVCGESSALMASIEGNVGEPRTKYIRSVERGLWNKPTVLNNVETLANIPYIMLHGEQFKQLGTKDSTGTKAFALVGKVKRTGLVEVPMGTTIRELVFDIGGGIPNGRKFKAVQTGGPSGGCIPEHMADLEMDFDNLTKYGSMMGSGGVIVMDDTTCMVEVARYYINFLAEESCGKCTPCREGLRRMLEILTDICNGKGQVGDIEEIENICVATANASLCALGKSAPNPVLTTLKYFRNEYEDHINKKFCSSGVCPHLAKFEIDSTKCTGCGLCLRGCPVNAITGEKRKPHIIDKNKCITCGSCRMACKFGAITVVKTEGSDKDE